MGGLEALLGGGGGAPPMPPGGGGGAPAPPQEGGGDVTTMLQDMLALAGEYLAQEETETNKLTMQKVTTMIQQILAEEEKELQGAMQGKMSPALLQKSYGA